MKYRILAVMGVGACLFAGSASAASTVDNDGSDVYSSGGAEPVYGDRGMEGPLSQVLNRLDHNADAFVTADEARQHTWFSDRQFISYDKNMDGTLDNAEIETAGAASLGDSG